MVIPHTVRVTYSVPDGKGIEGEGEKGKGREGVREKEAVMCYPNLMTSAEWFG